jgi:hypothetical protein
MARLLAYLLFSGLTVGAGLVVMDAARFTVRQVNEAQQAKCDALNAVTPGTCQMP